MKSLFTLFLIVTVFSASAQDGATIKYYDSLWHTTSKEKSFYYTKIERKEKGREYSSYFSKKGEQQYGSSTIVYDTNYLNKRIGLHINYYYKTGKMLDTILISGSNQIVYEHRYFENGNIQDSSRANQNGEEDYRYEYYETGKPKLIKHHSESINSCCFRKYVEDRFYENGVLSSHVYYDTLLNKIVGKGFDKSGKLIPDYIYRGGGWFSEDSLGWNKYLKANINTSLIKANGAPKGKYIIKAWFQIDKEGNVFKVTTKNDLGFGIKEEVIRVISNSPKWIPSISYNQPISVGIIEDVNILVE